MTVRRERTPLLDRFYSRYLNDEDSASFIAHVSSAYTIGSLERLAEGGSRVSRRAAILALGFVGDYAQNGILGRALCDADRAVRLLADHGIRQLWFRVADQVVRQRLGYLARLNARGHFFEAIDVATDLIDGDPLLAETRHQRGLAFYSQGLFGDAALDCQMAADINPYHFPAILTEAHCHIQLDDSVAALQSFRRALAIYPDLENVRAHVRQLERSIKDR
jgi:tetratricopeptide (TPR) repeat protein